MPLISKRLRTILHVPPSPARLRCQPGTRLIPTGLERHMTSLAHSPLDHTDFYPFFHFCALNIPLRVELEQLLTHSSHTVTWQHPPQVFLPQSKAEESPQRKPSGCFSIQLCSRCLGACVFYTQLQSTQLVSQRLLATYSTGTG